MVPQFISVHTPVRQHWVTVQSASVTQPMASQIQLVMLHLYPVGQLFGQVPSQPSDPQHLPVQLGMQSISLHSQTVRSHQ
jgi:hypothetical protein